MIARMSVYRIKRHLRLDICGKKKKKRFPMGPMQLERLSDIYFEVQGPIRLNCIEMRTLVCTDYVIPCSFSRFNYSPSLSIFLILFFGVVQKRLVT